MFSNEQKKTIYIVLERINLYKEQISVNNKNISN
jgi:hypothetical protein